MGDNDTRLRMGVVVLRRCLSGRSETLNEMLILNRLCRLCILFSALLLPFRKDKWTRVRTKNFELVGNASDKE